MTDPDPRTVILVVEDEAFVRMVAVDSLEEGNRRVLEAGCAEEALAVIAAEGRIDLLFTDINMPGELDGIELATIAIRRQHDLKLIVTSGAKSMTAADIPDHGSFISKPYSTRTLAQMVDAKLIAPR